MTGFTVLWEVVACGVWNVVNFCDEKLPFLNFSGSIAAEVICTHVQQNRRTTYQALEVYS